MELSDYENERLHVAWLASKDITSREFQDKFQVIWEQSKKEIQDSIKECGYVINLEDSKVLGLTLRSNRTFAFNPQVNGYLINIWYLLFCNDRQQAFIKPSWHLANSFVHEYNHYKFCRDHEMLFQDGKTTNQFIDANHKEADDMAYLEEINFLKKAETLAPKLVNTRIFFR